MTQEQRILSLLRSGRQLTKTQLMRLTNGTDKSVLGRISDLRASGFAIYTNRTKSGKLAYRLGTPSREMVAAAHAVAGSALFQ